MNPDLPTLADQRAAGLDRGDGETENSPGLTMCDHIRVAWCELASGRIAEAKLSTRKHRRKAKRPGGDGVD